MSNSSQILAFVFYNGRVFMGNEGAMFEVENIAIYLNRDCTFKELKAKVRNKLKLRRNQVISKVVVRLWRTKNPLTYHANTITDDEDMAMMMERFNQDPHLAGLELYVDITEASGSGPSQTSSHHTLTMGPQTHIGGGGAFGNFDKPNQGGTFDNTYESNVHHPYQGGTFDNPYETNVDQTVSLGNDDVPHMDVDAFEDSDDEDAREAGDIFDDESSDDGSSDDGAGTSELQRRPISPDSPPPLSVAPEAAGVYELNSFPHIFVISWFLI